MHVLLRAPLPTDAAILCPQVQGTGVTDTLLWDGPSSVEELAASLQAYGDPQVGHAFVVIVERATGKAVGSADVRATDDGEVGSVGLWIGPDHQGKGFGTEVVAALIEIGWGLGYRKLEAGIFVGNLASRRIFEKNGFQLTRTIADAVQKRGRSVDEWILTIERENV